ncbi:MAG: flippase [Patescibacteria group bacterium]
MSYTRKIAHNTIIQIIGKVASTAIGLVVIGLMTRYLREEGFGQYYTVMSFLQLFGILVDLGLYTILLKKNSEPGVDQDKMTSNIFTIRLISAVVFLGIAPLVALFFPYPSIVKWGIAATSVSFLCITLNQVLTGVFQKHLHMERVAMAEMAGRLALLAGTFMAIKLGLNLVWILASVSIGSLVNFILLFAYSRKYVQIRWAIDWPLWKEIVRETWPIALSIAFNLIYFKADAIILSLFKTQSDVGVYGAPYKVLEVLTTFPAMFAGLVMPLLAAAWAANDRERFQRVIRKSFNAMSLVALPLIVGTIFVAQPIMDLVAPEFRDSGALLQILIIATGIIFIGNVFGGAVVAINRQRAMMWLYMLVAAVSLAGFLIFIPHYSYFGAAWIRVLSELLVTIAAATIVLRFAHAKLSFSVFGKAVIATGLMAGSLWIFRHQQWFISIVVAMIVYASAILAMKGVTRETIREIISRNEA